MAVVILMRIKSAAPRIVYRCSTIIRHKDTTMRAALLFLGFAAAGMAHAENCSIDLKGDDAMKFDKSEVTVSASCKKITINLAHTGKMPVAAMGHNVVITTADDMQAVATAGMSAGAAANYVPADDKRVIAHTSIVGGGASTSATFAGNLLKAGGNYEFFCSFPGHYALMKGKLIVK